MSSVEFGSVKSFSGLLASAATAALYIYRRVIHVYVFRDFYITTLKLLNKKNGGQLNGQPPLSVTPMD